jgi:cell division septal protein FtsQ
MNVLALTMMGAFGAAGGGGLAGGVLEGAGRVLDFRRRGAPPRRRRRNPLLALARPLGVALAAVALPLALAVWVLTSPRFELRRVEVIAATSSRAAAAPADRVPAGWVQQSLAPLTGRNLLRLPLAEVRQRLAANPWIVAVDVAKQLPDRLRVSVAQRRPAVLLRSGGTLLYADAAGRAIAPVASPMEAAAAGRQGLLLVTVPVAGSGLADDRAAAEQTAAVAGALQLAARLRELRPAWTGELSQIDVVDEDDYRLHVAGLPCPLLVRGSQLAGNLERFAQLLPELRRRYPALAAIDLRFSRRIVVQPATRPAVQPATTPAIQPAVAPASTPVIQPATTLALQPPAAPAAAPRAPLAAPGGHRDETVHLTQTPGHP